MSVLIVGDLHFKPSNERQTLMIQNDIMQILSSRKIEFVVLLGDTLDSHEKINMECFNRACDLFDVIISTGIHLFVLIGNHDRANNKVYMTNRHPFRGYNNQRGITIVHRCYVHSHILEGLGTLKFCFVPFVPDGMYLQALEDCNINVKEISIFFSHSEFEGCKINRLTKSKCDKWPNEYPLNISGHIHDEEVVQPNLIYTGTPFQHTYADSSNKGLFLIDLTTSEYTLQKIKTSVPTKVVWKIHYTQLEQIVIDNSLDIRLDIYGPTAYVKEVMKRPDMVSKFNSVVKRYKDETKTEVIDSLEKPDTQQFHNVFLGEVGKDETMNFIYSILFKA